MALSSSPGPVLRYLRSAPSPTLRSLHGNSWSKVDYVAARVWAAAWRPSFNLSLCPEIAYSLTAPLANFVCPFRHSDWPQFQGVSGNLVSAGLPRGRHTPILLSLFPFSTRSLALQLSATKKNVYKLALKTLRIEAPLPLLSLRAIFSSCPQLVAL